MKIKINADDCGRTVNQTQHISQAICAGKVTSTTIMANMPDFDIAVKLYKRVR